MQCLRELFIVYNLEGKQELKNLSELVENTQAQTLGLQLLFFIPMSLSERAIVHIPVSMIYHSVYHFGMMALFYQHNGVKDHFNFIYKNKLSGVVKFTIVQMAIQYFTVLVVTYFKTKLYKSVS